MLPLNNSGPRVDAWGTRNKISAKELYEEFILVLCVTSLSW